MGLDMYLTKKTYVKNWNHMSDDEKHNVSVEGKSAKEIKPERITHIEEEVGYWRKANQIHNWFVQNVQNGNDDCGSHYVSVELLEQLLAVCKKVEEDNELASILLPTQLGFFFGNTDYDEWYLQTIDQTIEILQKLDLENTTDEFYYQASW